MLRKALSSVFESLSPFGEKAEILVLINGPDPESLKVLGDFPEVKVLSLPVHQHPGQARNSLVAEAQGDYCVFLDDDLTVPKNYFEVLQGVISSVENHSVFGGPNWTPESSSFFQRLQGKWLSDPWLVGPVARRYHLEGSEPVGEESLILCNLTIKAPLAKNFPFTADLICAEENEWLSRLESAGHHFYASSELGVFHERRANFAAFLQQIKKYGYGRGQIFLRSRRRWYHWFPSLAFLGALAGFVLVPQLVLFVFSAYWLIWLVQGSLISSPYTIRERLLTVALMPWVHLTYALFVLRGMQDSITRKAWPF